MGGELGDELVRSRGREIIIRIYYVRKKKNLFSVKGKNKNARIMHMQEGRLKSTKQFDE